MKARRQKRSSRVRRIDRLAPRDEDGRLRVVVETPRGSRVKINYDPEIRAFAFSRALPAGMMFPFDFGFVPGTKAEDGDPLDVLVLHDAPTYPGVVITSEVVGAIGLSEDGESGGRIRNDRILAVPADDAAASSQHGRRALSRRRKAEIEAFLSGASAFENKDVRILGWRSREEALRLVAKACKGSRRR